MIAAAVEQLIKVVRVAVPVEVFHDGRLQVVELVRLTWTDAASGWECTAAVLVGRQTAHDGIRRVGDLTCAQYDPRTALDLPEWLPALIDQLTPASADGPAGVVEGPTVDALSWLTDNVQAAPSRRSAEAAGATHAGSALTSTDASPGAGRDAEGDEPAFVPLGHPFTATDVELSYGLPSNLLERRPR